MYKNYRNVLTKTLKQAKKMYYCNKFNSVKGNSGKTWNVINEILNRNNGSMAPNKLVLGNNGGRVITDCTNIANEFCKYFSEIGPNLASKISDDINFQNYLKQSRSNSFFFRPVVPGDIIKELRSLDSSKTPGYDFTHDPLLTIHAAEYIAGPIAHIINLSIPHGVFPDCLKVAKITPVYKKGCPFDVGNYRPISILPVLNQSSTNSLFPFLTNMIF